MSGPGVVDRLRVANSRLRELLAARDAELASVLAVMDAELMALRREKDAENAELRAALKALALRVAELERQRESGSDDSGMPSSKEPIAAKARRRAERKARRDTDTSSRERSADRARVGSRGIRAAAWCVIPIRSSARRWIRRRDVKVIPWRAEYLLPRRECPCGTMTTAVPPSGGSVNGISYGPVLNTAAVLNDALATRNTGTDLSWRDLLAARDAISSRQAAAARRSIQPREHRLGPSP